MIYTGKFQDLTGQKFGRLTVIERVEDHVKPSGRRATQWLCKCDCGNKIIVRASNLKSGHTNSCGCLNKERVKETSTKHRMSHSRIYNIWSHMKQRCLDKNSNDYNDYGGRGINVCNEWLEFEPFCKWSTENGYNDSLTIDRINVNGNYEPSNCRWVSMKTQQNNKRNNNYITYDGKTQTLTQWSEELNINYDTLNSRISRGWSIDRAFNT